MTSVHVNPSIPDSASRKLAKGFHTLTYIPYLSVLLTLFAFISVLRSLPRADIPFFAVIKSLSILFLYLFLVAILDSAFNRIYTHVEMGEVQKYLTGVGVFIGSYILVVLVARQMVRTNKMPSL